MSKNFLDFLPYPEETTCILSGSRYINFEDKKKYFSKNVSIYIESHVDYSIFATENTVLHDVSYIDR